MLNRRDILKYAAVNGFAIPGFVAPSYALTLPMMSVEKLNGLTSGKPTKAPVIYGSAFDDTWSETPNLAKRSVYLKHVQEITDGNCSGLTGVMVKQGVINTGRFDKVVNFAVENKLRLKSGNLIWGGSETDWAKKLTSFIEIEKLMKGHIGYMCDRYRGRVTNWCVVNEPIAEKPNSIYDMRPSIYQKAMGESHIAECFKFAAQVDPTAKLIINEYAIENMRPQSKIKRDGYKRVIYNLLDRGVPLHGVGLQGHLEDNVEIDKEGLSRFCEDMKKAKLEVYVTELDMSDMNLIASIEERDRMVALRIYDFLRAIYDATIPASVTTWGLIDSETWLDMWYKRKDGQPLRPLPLDSFNNPKPFMKVIEHFTKGYY